MKKWYSKSLWLLPLLILAGACSQGSNGENVPPGIVLTPPSPGAEDAPVPNSNTNATPPNSPPSTPPSVPSAPSSLDRVHTIFAAEYNLDKQTIVKTWNETMGENTEFVPMDQNGLNHFFLFIYQALGKNSDFQKNMNHAGEQNSDAIGNIKSSLQAADVSCLDTNDRFLKSFGLMYEFIDKNAQLMMLDLHYTQSQILEIAKIYGVNISAIVDKDRFVKDNQADFAGDLAFKRVDASFINQTICKTAPSEKELHHVSDLSNNLNHAMMNLLTQVSFTYQDQNGKISYISFFNFPKAVLNDESTANDVRLSDDQVVLERGVYGAFPISKMEFFEDRELN
jgi:hypothetical protein